jgi:HNH endonuclease
MKPTLRKAVCERAADCCEYCQMQANLSHDPFSAEHILPISKGGLDALNNLAWACLGCNLYKATTTYVFDLLTGDLVPLYNPRTEKWSDHFEWSENFSIIVGTTPIGRATITCLKLNRIGLINLRKILVAVGKHPPNV